MSVWIDAIIRPTLDGRASCRIREFERRINEPTHHFRSDLGIAGNLQSVIGTVDEQRVSAERDGDLIEAGVVVREICGATKPRT